MSFPKLNFYHFAELGEEEETLPGEYLSWYLGGFWPHRLVVTLRVITRDY